MCNIAVVSMHSSPLARPGTRDTGGMNIYIRELSRQMGRRAHSMDIFTRRSDPSSPEVTVLDERTRVIQLDAGPREASKANVRRYTAAFADEVIRFQQAFRLEYDLVHSHYCLSGQAGTILKSEWNAPHVVMF